MSSVGTERHRSCDRRPRFDRRDWRLFYVPLATGCDRHIAFAWKPLRRTDIAVASRSVASREPCREGEPVSVHRLRPAAAPGTCTAQRHVAAPRRVAWREGCRGARPMRHGLCISCLLWAIWLWACNRPMPECGCAGSRGGRGWGRGARRGRRGGRGVTRVSRALQCEYTRESRQMR
jgi:hypothetical protein